MSKNDSLIQHDGKRMNKDLMPDYNDNKTGIETNAMRQADRDEMLLTHPILDANCMSDEDFENMVNSPVLDYYGRVMGYKSEIRRKKK